MIKVAARRVIRMVRDAVVQAAVLPFVELLISARSRRVAPVIPGPPPLPRPLEHDFHRTSCLKAGRRWRELQVWSRGRPAFGQWRWLEQPRLSTASSTDGAGSGSGDQGAGYDRKIIGRISNAGAYIDA